MFLGLQKVRTDVLFHDLRGQSGHCGAGTREEMHDLVAAGLTFQGPLDRFDLAANAAHSEQEFVFITDSMRHPCIIP